MQLHAKYGKRARDAIRRAATARRAYEELQRDADRAARLLTTPLLQVRCLDLPLPSRVRYACIRAGAETVEQLIQVTAGDLLRGRNCGQVTVGKIRQFLADHRLHLKGE